MAHRITVVVSQSQSANPAKRRIEEEIVADLLMSRGIDVTVVPHLYDLKADGTGMLCLQGISGDLVLCSWLFPRAAFWILDRNGIRGQEGQSLIKPFGAEDSDEDDEQEQAEADDKERLIDRREIPRRKIYCLDLRTHASSAPYLEEIKRIAKEASTTTVDLLQWIGGTQPSENTDPVSNSTPSIEEPAPTDGLNQSVLAPTIVTEDADRRWYPVIDYSRCTNCLECIDFCLFGVYGIDRAEAILVEQPDNCRKGCPACSRVCPENAIIFPQHKTPTIAGSPEVAGGIKIDLSLLFGAPDPGAAGAPSAVEIAARERDEQLLLAGRDAVGMNIGITKRQNKPSEPKDELDALMDQLDDLDL